MTTKHDEVRIRNTHPGLYSSIMTISITSMFLALNFWGSNPTFNPYGISKNHVGIVFFVLGASQFLFLNVFRNLRMVRRILAISFSFMGFWAFANTQQFFSGNASLQLPILYLALAVLQLFLLTEAPVNPMTKRGD